MTSSRTWIANPEGNVFAHPGSGKAEWIRDDDERAVTAVFKAPSTQEARYGIAMERVAYALAAAIGVPVPVTYLELYANRNGSIQVIVPGIMWRHAEAGVSWLVDSATDTDVWPLGVLFDTWLAHPDRHASNIMIRPEPVGTRPAVARSCTIWLVDNERCGLWPPTKFGATQINNVVVGADGAMRPEAETAIRTSMPARFRASLEALSAAEREPLLEVIRRVPDNTIRDAVEEVPDFYLSRRARDLTISLLVARRDSLAILASSIFPEQSPT